jgi:oligoribonuclease
MNLTNLDFTPNLFWVDLEMSGLDPMKNRILEFACILTDANLTKRIEGPQIIIHCD